MHGLAVGYLVVKQRINPFVKIDKLAGSSWQARPSKQDYEGGISSTGNPMFFNLVNLS